MFHTRVGEVACSPGDSDFYTSSYSAAALSDWPWFPLQLMPIPLYPVPSFSIVSHQASLNRPPHRLSAWVWVVLCLFFFQTDFYTLR